MQRQVALAIVLCVGMSAGDSAAIPIISEVMFNPAGADDNREWIELYNPDPTPLDVSAWSLGWAVPTIALAPYNSAV